MSEKYIPPTPAEKLPGQSEVLRPQVELLFPPRPLAIPTGTSVRNLAERNLFAVPDMATVDEYSMPEAYLTALGKPETVEAKSIELTACTVSNVALVEGKKTVEVIADLVAQIDTQHPWRLATLDEMMAFGIKNPDLVDTQPLVALGETDLNHFPVALARTAVERLEEPPHEVVISIQGLVTHLGPLTQVGTKILIVRALETTSGADAVISADVAPQSPEPVESFQEKVQAFYQELEKIPESDIEQLRSITHVTQLLGEKYTNLASELGDMVVDKIMNEVILARKAGTKPGEDGLYRIAPEREAMCVANIERTGQVVDGALKDRLLAILRDPELLNSETMNLRERIKEQHSVLAQILKSLESDIAFSRQELDQLTKLRKTVSSAIGNQNKLNMIHPEVN